MISLSVGLVMVAFCEMQNLSFSSILCHLFLVVFLKYISIKSLGVKGYSVCFLTVNDMISQKKLGKFSHFLLCIFVCVCFHCRL